MIIPSIDLSHGKVVQWRQGREPVLERDDPYTLAQVFARHGEIAVIDLDAALGCGENSDIIRRLCKIAPCRVGGGIRTIETGRRLLRAGARRIIVGTQATPQFLSNFHPSHVLAALDERGGEVVDHGWQNSTGHHAIEQMAVLRQHVSGFVYTMVDREGMLSGADIDRFREVSDASDLPVTVAGGISSVSEVVELAKLGIDCQVGMALYTGRIDLTDATVACVDFRKSNGLVPAIVCDKAGRVRMQAWMNPEALYATLHTGKVHFWSRSRACLWRKGDTSGHSLDLRTLRLDCDRDSIQIVADTHGPTCHRMTQSCFGNDNFHLLDLEEVLHDRIANFPPGSWTSRLASDPALLRTKLIEEAGELAAARGEEEIGHEAADLLYHLMATLAARDVPWSRVISELNARRQLSSGRQLEHS
jgi:phosphoribosylformimino-5-aminoimidazole carboxamide ribotide isomerase